MKIAVTADVHYGVGNNQNIVRKFAKKMLKKKPDVIIVATNAILFNRAEKDLISV